jgi:hypothetical protein
MAAYESHRYMTVAMYATDEHNRDACKSAQVADVALIAHLQYRVCCRACCACVAAADLASS